MLRRLAPSSEKQVTKPYEASRQAWVDLRSIILNPGHGSNLGFTRITRFGLINLLEIDVIKF